MSERIVDNPGNHGWVEENGKWVWEGGSTTGHIEDGTIDGQITTWDVAKTEWMPSDDMIVKGGQVGIGNTNPNLSGSPVALTVGSSSALETSIEIQANRNTNSNVGSLRFYNASNQIGSIAAQRNATDNTGDLTFFTANAGTLSERMRIDANGEVICYKDFKVGDTNSAENPQIVMMGPTNALATFMGGRKSIGFKFANVDGELMRIDASGNVGIGGAPTANLDVISSSGYPSIKIDATGGSNGWVQLQHGVSTSASWLYASASLHFGSGGEAERVTIDANGRVGIGGQPSRSSKEIEEDAESTLASWKSHLDDRLKAEPKADKKAVTLEITGHDKMPTKAELVERLTERNIGGGDAKLQVDGDGYFIGTVTTQKTRAQRFIQDGSPVIDAKGLIETLSTLRASTLDETVDVRQALSSACDKLIEKFEAMQAEAVTQEIPE